MKTLLKIQMFVKRLIREERADEMLEKAAVIAIMTIAVMALAALAALAAGAFESAQGWF